jgi:hypothetical protein
MQGNMNIKCRDSFKLEKESTRRIDFDYFFQTTGTGLRITNRAGQKFKFNFQFRNLFCAVCGSFPPTDWHFPSIFYFYLTLERKSIIRSSGYSRVWLVLGQTTSSGVRCLSNGARRITVAWNNDGGGLARAKCFQKPLAHLPLSLACFPCGCLCQ